MPDDSLVALALRLTDGESIDWKAESQAGLVDLSLLQKLKQIEAVARAHEGVDTLNQDDVFPSRVGGPFWGHLEIIELIGSGSYGDVYRARDTRLGRDVALKLLRTRDAIKSHSTSLVREGHLLSRVRHANVVTVYGADCLNGQTGLWMELIEGETLEQEVRRRGAFQGDEVAQIGAFLCDALEAVHSAGLLHRDVKAQNVMRDRAGRLVLMDFGSGHEAQRFSGCTVEGTPLYAAPEILNGAEASVRSDIYSLGVLLWYLLMGSYPVNGRSVDEIRRAHARGQIATLEYSGASSALTRIAAWCLATDPRKRPPTANELGRRLRKSGEPSTSRHSSIRNRTALGVFAAAVLLLATIPLQFSSKAESRALGEPIWSFDSGAVPSGAPSADGQYFACRGLTTVAICDVTTGTVQRVPITERKVFDARPLISPDGKRLAYHGLELEEAKIFDLSTSISKSLRVEPSFFVKIIAWSATGDSLLVVLLPVGGRPGGSVALLDANTGSLTDLKQLDAIPDQVALSHDRRHLAFTQSGNLNLTNLVTGETLHIAGPSDVRGSLLWTPNDDGLLFTSGSSLSELHLMPLTDGHPAGEIEALHVYGAPPFTLLGISAAGDVYYNAESRFHIRMTTATGHVISSSTSPKTYPQPATLYLAPFDTATQQIGTPTNIAKLASRLDADWSPDSTSIAYARSDGTKTPTIVIRNARTGVERAIELPDEISDLSARHPFEGESPPWVGVVRWSPRGKILAHSSSHEYLVDSDDMSVRRVELPPVISRVDDPSLKREVFIELYMPASVEWAPDGSSVLYAGNGSVRGVDVDTGLMTESHTLPDIAYRSWVQLSAGRRLVAFNKPSDGREAGQVQVAALDDSVPSPLLTSDRPCRPVGWWNGEVFVACANDSKAPSLSQLYLVDVATGTQRTMPVNLQRIEHVRVRPDGRTIAIMTGWTAYGTFVLKVPNR